ncbi:acyltransferase [Prochlorococcus marinus XMU1406]|uniref:acyltransferase family protein n=1 Tax=Prochlorococcus marinus TaxID=1219 RepID=UPI001ADCEF2A|nr:acyltransferase family protein [Prochlorococcus marinus]MBO8205484.1 acyltransferase [Prochlorococcus marinus XMU1406]MCR8543160.1 acyltransferase [Prochlorococcus marinus XMU1427]
MSIDIEDNKSSKKSQYRPEIDGLRAFAVIAVIINHFNKNILPGGYLGVDIFFVISGFVITSSLYQRPSKNFKDFISGFYERRIRRLIPALSVFVLIMSIAICLFNPNPILSLRTGLTSLFGLSNLYLIRQSTDYFAQSTELNVFTHTWSLGVEEQFYFLFPFLIWFSGFGRQTKNGSRNLFLVVGALTIASLIGFIYLYQINQPAAYFLMPTRFWEMAFGCLLFIGFQKSKYIEQLLEKAPPLLVLALIVGVMYLPMSWATTSTIAVVALSSLLIVSLKKETTAFKVFTNSKVVYLGLISYLLYLWHWGVLSISRWTIGIHWWSVPFQIALILGLAIASYRYIETPLRKGNWFEKFWKTFLVGIGIIIPLSGGIITLEKPLKSKLFIGNKYNKWNMKIYNRKIVINNSPLLPTIYLLGDSHAGHYGAVIDHLAAKKKHNLKMHPGKYGLNGRKINKDQYILAPLRKYKNEFKKNDIIIFSAHTDQYKKGKDWTKKYETYLYQTQNIGMKFILISPTPHFSGLKEGYTCQEEWYRPYWAISPFCFKEVKKSEWFASNAASIAKIEQFLLANPKVSYLDAFSILCPDPYCKNHDQLSVMYRDEHHLSSYGAMKVSNAIENFIGSK